MLPVPKLSLEPGLFWDFPTNKPKSDQNYQVLTNVEFKKGEVIDIVTKNLTKATLGQLELAEPQEKNIPPKEKAAPAKPSAPTKPAATKSSPKKAEPKNAEQTEKPKDV